MKKIIKDTDFAYFPVPKAIAMEAGLNELLQSLIRNIDFLRQKIEVSDVEKKMLLERLNQLEKEVELLKNSNRTIAA